MANRFSEAVPQPSTAPAAVLLSAPEYSTVRVILKVFPSVCLPFFWWARNNHAARRPKSETLTFLNSYWSELSSGSTTPYFNDPAKRSDM